VKPEEGSGIQTNASAAPTVGDTRADNVDRTAAKLTHAEFIRI